MSKAMSTMGYYIVLAFFAALFIAAFGAPTSARCSRSRAPGGAPGARAARQVTIVGIILLSASSTS
jgi:aminobenzoyl-glutamate transport protein